MIQKHNVVCQLQKLIERGVDLARSVEVVNPTIFRSATVDMVMACVNRVYEPVLLKRQVSGRNPDALNVAGVRLTDRTRLLKKESSLNKIATKKC
jgi:hypothetical protein